jgi:hypothetical protein
VTRIAAHDQQQNSPKEQKKEDLSLHGAHCTITDLPDYCELRMVVVLRSIPRRVGRVRSG